MLFAERLVVDKFRARVVGLGVGHFMSDLDSLVAVRGSVFVGIHFRRYELDQIVPALCQNLAAGRYAQPDEFGHRAAALGEHPDVGWHHGLEFIRYHGSVGDSGKQRFVAIEIGPLGSQLHIGEGNVRSVQHAAKQQVGQRPGRRNGDCFPL